MADQIYSIGIKGAQFTSCDFFSLVKDNEIKISMDEKAGGWIMSVLNDRGGA